jgi:hypothetical protein
VLRLHERLMRGLLTDETEDLPGMYRKVKVVVSGSSTQRAHPDYIEYAMAEFFGDTLLRLERARESLTFWPESIQNSKAFTLFGMVTVKSAVS